MKMSGMTKARIVTGASGFTLLEVLVAVTITAVIGLGVWQVVSGIIQARDRVDAVAEQFDQLQRAFLLMERDFSQAVNRPIRNLYGDAEPALTSLDDRYALALTRQGWRNPIGARRSTLQRVAYEFTGEELYRRYWPVLDQGQDDRSQDQRLLSGVKTFDVEFMDREHNWLEQWPSQEAMSNAQDGGAINLPLPLAIRIRLEHQLFGDLERLFVLPSFDRNEVQGAMSEMGQPSPEDDSNEESAPEQQDTGQQQPGGVIQ